MIDYTQSVTIKKAREILGKDGKAMTDKEINELILYFETLADSVLESYEKETFGKSLNELLINIDKDK